MGDAEFGAANGQDALVDDLGLGGLADFIEHDRIVVGARRAEPVLFTEYARAGRRQHFVRRFGLLQVAGQPVHPGQVVGDVERILVFATDRFAQQRDSALQGQS